MKDPLFYDHQMPARCFDWYDSAHSVLVLITTLTPLCLCGGSCHSFALAWSDAWSQLIGKSNFITRPKLLDYTATREELLWRSGEVFGWVADGKMKVSVDKTFPLAECGDGHRYLEAGKSTGKVLYDCANLSK